MKTLRYLSLALSIGFVQAEPLIELSEKKSPIQVDVEKAGDAYRAAVHAAQAAYRKSFAETLLKASRIEVFLLDSFTMKAEKAASDSAWAIRLPDDQFPVIPYGHRAGILRRKELSADEIKFLLPSLVATVSVEVNRAGLLCHYPVHGIRVWDGDRIAFQTTISYECREFYMEYPVGDAGFVSLSSPEFAEAMNLLMPIPVKSVSAEEKDVQQGAVGGDKPKD